MNWYMKQTEFNIIDNTSSKKIKSYPQDNINIRIEEAVLAIYHPRAYVYCCILLHICQ